MASITIRNLDDDIKSRLRVQAAKNNRSMEDEARQILRHALSPKAPESNLADLALGLFGKKYGIELDEHPVVAPDDMDFE